MSSDYTILYSDTTKNPITVTSGTINYTTSLGLPGRNSKGFGQVFAEDFVYLLENFASPFPPVNPIEGQLWYDTSDTNNKVLKINDSAAQINGANWYPANGIFRQDTEPTNIRLGDIWVDTGFQQLKIYNGITWTLVGPGFSSSFQTGSYPEIVRGTDGVDHFVIKNYLNGNVITVIAQEQFRPIEVIEGFTSLSPGVNLSSSNFTSSNGSTSPATFSGLATRASALAVTTPFSAVVTADNFFRKDIPQTLSQFLTIDNNTGLVIGQTSSTFMLQKSNNDAVILNVQDSAKIIFKIDKGKARNSILTIAGENQRVGINQVNPTTTLDVVGTFKVLNTSTFLDNVSVAKNILILGTGTNYLGGTTTIVNTTTFQDTIIVKNILATNSTNELGSENIPFGRVWANNIGTTATIFNGKAGSAQKLAVNTQFSMSGQVSAVPISYNGTQNVAFTATVTAQSILGQQSTTTVASSNLIPISDGVSIFKVNKSDFLADVMTKTARPGMVMAWAGTTIEAPSGWVFCDGLAYNITGAYNTLYAVLGTKYGSGSGTFNVPTIPDLISGQIKYIIKV